MYKPNTGHLNTIHMRELLKLPNGKRSYAILVSQFHFLKGLKHICVKPEIMKCESIIQEAKGLDCDSGGKPLEKVKCLSEFLETIQRQRIKNVEELMEEVQHSHERRVEKSTVLFVMIHPRVFLLFQ